MADGRKKLSFFEEQLLFELRAIRFAILDHSKNTGKWLAIVAQAAASPTDNSTEVQKQIDQATEELKSSTNALDATVKAHQPK